MTRRSFIRSIHNGCLVTFRSADGGDHLNDIEKNLQMKKTVIAATVVAFSVCSVPAFADDDAAIVTGTGGAVTGAIVGGPVGAVIGGALGMIAGASLDPPPCSSSSSH